MATPPPGAPLRVAVCQLHAAPADVARNVATVDAVLAALAGAADLVVFPETFLQGYCIGRDAFLRTACDVPAEWGAAQVADAAAATHPLLAVAAAARRHGVAVVLPFAERRGDALFNSSIAVDADGAPRGLYRKSHLWSAYEGAIFTPGPGRAEDWPACLPGEGGGGGGSGDPFTPFTLARFPHTPVGLLVCFDLEFPEPARALALRGAKVVVSTHASGEGAGFTSTHFVRVRAAENDVAVVYCNYPSAPQQPSPATVIDLAFSGGSAVAAPDGAFLHALPVYPCNASKAPAGAPREATTSEATNAAAGAAVHAALSLGGKTPLSASDEAVFVVAVDPHAPRYVANRSRNPYLRDRRRELFGGLAK
jgi:5-aminopentanamidase